MEKPKVIHLSQRVYNKLFDLTVWMSQMPRSTHLLAPHVYDQLLDAQIDCIPPSVQNKYSIYYVTVKHDRHGQIAGLQAECELIGVTETVTVDIQPKEMK